MVNNLALVDIDADVRTYQTTSNETSTRYYRTAQPTGSYRHESESDRKKRFYRNTLRDNIVNAITIIGIIVIMFTIGFNAGKAYHTNKSLKNSSGYYYGTIEAIVRNKGLVRINANNTVYEIGYNERFADGSSTVLIEVDNEGNLINVWNLAYNIEENS